MKKSVFFLLVVFTTLFCNYSYSQITAADGLRMPGDWNAWTNTHAMGGTFDLVKITTGTARWQTSWKYTGATGSQTFKFASGGSGSEWYNQWGSNGAVNIDDFSTITYGNQGGTPPGNNTISVVNNAFYTVNWEDVGYTNSRCVFMATSTTPVTFSSVNFLPAAPLPYEEVAVTLTSSASLSAEELVFLRYTTDGYTTSSLVPVIFAGTNGSATIPALAEGTNLSFYIFSTTLTEVKIGADYDLATINLINNTGSNYTYTVQTPPTFTSTQAGAWSLGTSWIGGIAPSSGANVVINHAVLMKNDVTVFDVLINAAGTLTFQNGTSKTMTIEKFGSWTNDGTAEVNDGNIIVKNDVSFSGANLSSYNNLTIQGENVSFVLAKSQVRGVMNITSGSITSSPEMMDGSTLQYSQVGNVTRGVEWNNPYNVFVVNSTNLKLNIDALGSDLTVAGDMEIEAGSSVDMENTTYKLLINGYVYFEGSLILSTAVGGDLELKGDFDFAGTFTPNSRMVTLNASSDEQYIIGDPVFDYVKIDNAGSECVLDGVMTVNQAMSVENGAFLYLDENVIDGTGSFELISGGTIVIAEAGGISSSGATGNIQVSGTRTFSSGGTYNYIGYDNQIVGNGLPSSVANLIVELDAGATYSLTFASDYSVTNLLTLEGGRLDLGANTLTIENTNANSLVAGASNLDFQNSFVVGSLKRRISIDNDFYFPVGTSSNAQLGELDFTALTSGGTPYITASFTDDSPTPDITSLNLEVNNDDITDRLDNGYWTFSPTDVTTFEANITLTNTGQSNGSTNPEAFALIKRNGGDWFIPDGTHSNTTQSISGGKIVAARSGITAFSDYATAFNKLDVTLPVELLNFYAEKDNKEAAEIIWNTASESNNDFFLLERSTNGVDFVEIAKLNGQGNTKVKTHYNYFDNIAGLNQCYYRLKQVDFDSKYTYSKIINLLDATHDARELEFNVSNGNLIIISNELLKGDLNVLVYNSIGQLIMNTKESIYGSDIINIPVNLKQGVYVVKCQIGKEFYNSKVFVK